MSDSTSKLDLSDPYHYCINHWWRYATYDVPKDFCDVCWEMWMTEGYTFIEEEELVEIRKDDLRQTWSNFGSPGEEAKRYMLIEIENLTRIEYQGLSGIYRWLSCFFNKVRLFLTKL